MARSRRAVHGATSQRRWPETCLRQGQEVSATTKHIGSLRYVIAIAATATLTSSVVWAGSDGVAAKDSALKTRVETALAQDPQLKGARVRVRSVEAGIVLLESDAMTPLEHLRALEVASDVVGVRRVASEINSHKRRAEVDRHAASARRVSKRRAPKQIVLVPPTKATALEEKPPEARPRTVISATPPDPQVPAPNRMRPNLFVMWFGPKGTPARAVPPDSTPQPPTETRSPVRDILLD